MISTLFKKLSKYNRVDYTVMFLCIFPFLLNGGVYAYALSNNKFYPKSFYFSTLLREGIESNPGWTFNFSHIYWRALLLVYLHFNIIYLLLSILFIISLMKWFLIYVPAVREHYKMFLLITFLSILNANFGSIKEFVFSTLLREGIESNPGWFTISRIVIADQIEISANALLIDFDNLPPVEDGRMNQIPFNFTDFMLLFLYDAVNFQVGIVKLTQDFDLSVVDDGVFINNNFTLFEVDNIKEFTVARYNMTGLKLMFDVETNPGEYNQDDIDLDLDFNTIFNDDISNILTHRISNLRFVTNMDSFNDKTICVDFDSIIEDQYTTGKLHYMNYGGFDLILIYDYELFRFAIVDRSDNCDFSCANFDFNLFLDNHFEDVSFGNCKAFIAYLINLTRIRLMFDIETNPGENYNDVIALYLDCLNVTALPKEQFQFYIVDLDGRFNFLKWQYHGCSTDGLDLIFSQIDNFLHPSAQMMGAFNPLNYLANPINNLADSIKNAKADINLSTETLNSLFDIATKVSDVNVGINTATRDFLTPSVPDVLNLSNIFLWLQSPKNQICTLSILLVILLLTRRTYPSCTELMILCAAFGTIAAVTIGTPTIVKIVSNWINPIPQGGDDDWITICGEVLSFGFFSKSINFLSVDGFATSLSRIEKQSRGFSDYLDRLKSLITKMVRKLAEVFGYELSLGFDKHAITIRGFTKRLMVLKQDPILFNGNITFRFCNDVKSLDNDINNYLIKIEAVRDNASYSIALQNLLRLMSPLLSIIRNSQIRRIVREVPFNINLVGPSGVGKTQLTTLIISMMFAKFASDDQKARADGNFFNMCYALGLGDKFCDTYNDNFAFIFNDFLQRLEIEGMSPSDVLLFIQMLGNSPTPLNCAELTKKGLVMFVSEFIVTSMNMYRVTSQQCKVLTHIEALTRRLNDNMNILVTIKPEYQIEDCKPIATSLDDPKFWAGLDKNKAMLVESEHGINTDVYLFDEWDSATGTYKLKGFRNLNYTQMIDLMSDRFIKHRAHQKAISDKTAKYLSTILDKPEAIPELLEMACSDAPFAPFKIKTQGDIDETLHNDYSEHYPDGFDNYHDTTILNDSILSEINDLILRDNSFRESTTNSLLLESIPEEGLCAWISRYISACFQYGYRLTIGGEYGVYKSINNIYNRILQSCNWCDLFYIANSGINYSDNVIYYSLIFRDKFLDMTTSLYTIGCSLINRISDEVKDFTVNPLLWLSNNPYLSMLGIVGVTAGSILIYKGINLFIDAVMTLFKVNPTNEYNSEILVSDNIHSQSDRKEDHNLNYMRGPLRNFMKVVIRSRIGTTTDYYKNVQCRAIGICGREILLPYHVDHFVRSSKLRPSISTVQIGFIPLMSNIDDPLEWYFYDTLLKDYKYKDRDLMFITLPPHVNEFPDIREYFPKDTIELRSLIQQRSELSASMFLTRHGLTSREKVTLQYLDTFTYTISSDLMDPSDGKYYNAPKEVSVLSYPMRVSYPTAVGDCATATFIDDPIYKTLTSVDSCLQNPTLGYIHLAGHSSVGIGYGNYIFRDMFSHFVYGNKVRPIATQISEEFQKRSRVFEDVVGTQGMIKEYLEIVEKQPSNFMLHHEVIGLVPSLPVNTISKISKSELFQDVKKHFGVTKYPVQLYDGGGKTPLITARAGYGSNIDFSIDHARGFLVAEDVVSELFDNSKKPTIFRVYTTHEVLEGVPSEGIRSNDRSTSWGYPMKILCKSFGISPSDMRWAFGRGDKYEYDTPLAKIVLSLCDEYDIQLQNGGDMLALYMDCVKDELKDEDKARLFCACDKLFLLQCKKYFGAFANWIYENRIRNGIAVGVNPYADWDIFYKWLTEVGQYGIAGDYRWYDKKQVQFLMFVCKMSIDRYYYLSPLPEKKARDSLWNSTVRSFHVALSKGLSYVYEWFHAVVSGHFLTAIINSLDGLFIVKYCAVDILTKEFGGISLCSIPQLNVALKLCRMYLRVQTYGDDNVIMVHPSLRMKITFYTLQKTILKHFNLDYTDEQKGKRIGYVVPDHSHITALSFIARGFRQQGSIVVGPLRDSSVFETLAWYKNTRDRKELLLRVERTLKELSPRGPEEFYAKSQPIIEMCMRHLKIPPKFQLWDSAFSAYCAEEVLSFDPHVIYRSLDPCDFTFQDPDFDESD